MIDFGLILFSIIVGHLVGDYILQNDWMALNKKKMNFEGWLSATVHCFIYSFCVCLSIAFIEYVDTDLFLMIFISHFIFDKFEIVE